MTAGAVMLLLALCGGYYFVSVFAPTKYHSAREVGHRFYFRVVHYTFWLALAASLLLLGISRNAPEPWLAVVAWTIGQVPFPETYLEVWARPLSYGVAPFTLLLAIVSSHGLNWLLRLWPGIQNQILSHAVAGRDFEQLILHARLVGEPLLLTLESGKAYVGLVRHAINPARPREYLRILPVLEGYTDQQTQSVVLSSEFDATIWNLAADGIDESPSQRTGEGPALVIPVDRIVAACIFDRTLHQRPVPKSA